MAEWWRCLFGRKVETDDLRSLIIKAFKHAAACGYSQGHVAGYVKGRNSIAGTPIYEVSVDQLNRELEEETDKFVESLFAGPEWQLTQ